MPSFNISILENAYDPSPFAHKVEWPADFTEATEVPDASDASKCGVAAFIPAIFKPGKGREKRHTEDNIETMTAIVLDYDEDQHADLDRALTFWRGMGVAAVFYTTFSHRPEAHSFRVVIPLAAPVSVATFRLLWSWATSFAAEGGVPCDSACKDPSHLYFSHTIIRGIEQQPRVEVLPGPFLDPGDLMPLLGTIEDPTSTGPVDARTLVNKASVSTGTFDRINKKSPPMENIDAIEAKCLFMAHCRDDAETLLEPHWRSWLSILNRCIGGREYAHQIGSRHPGYSEAETNAKIERLDAEITGPHTCAMIRSHAACAGCPLGEPLGKIVSPVQLGRPDPATATPEEVTADLAARVEVARQTVAEAQAAVDAAALPTSEEQAQIAAAEEAVAAATREVAAAKANAGHNADKEGAAVRVADAATALAKAKADAVALRTRWKKERKKQEKEAKEKAKAAADALDSAERDQSRTTSGAHQGTFDALQIDPKTGLPRPVLGTMITILSMDPVYQGRIWRDGMRGIDMIRDSDTARAVSERDLIGFRSDVYTRYSVAIGHPDTDHAVQHVAALHTVNPLTDYLKGLTWDGVPRLGMPLVDRLGVSKDDVHRAMYAKYLTRWPIAAVARAVKPGTQADGVLTLQGARGGENKTSFFRKLAGPFFGEAQIVPDGHQGDLLDMLNDSWIHEIAESTLKSRRDQAKAKAFLTLIQDRGRKAFARKAEKRLRHFLFGVSINDREFLDADDGGEMRRYWVVPVGTIDLAWVETSRDQLWAEAVHRFAAGEKHWFDPAEIDDVHVAGRSFSKTDPWDDEIARFLGDKIQVTMSDVLVSALSLAGRDLKHESNLRAAKCLKRLGWHPRPGGTTSINGIRGSWWIKTEPATSENRPPDPTPDAANEQKKGIFNR